MFTHIGFPSTVIRITDDRMGFSSIISCFLHPYPFCSYAIILFCSQCSLILSAKPARDRYFAGFFKPIASSGFPPSSVSTSLGWGIPGGGHHYRTPHPSQQFHLWFDKIIHKKLVFSALNATISLHHNSTLHKKFRWIRLPYLGRLSSELSKILRRLL